MREKRALRENGLFLKWKHNKQDVSRFAIIVSSRVAKKATDRNRLKRLLRAALFLRKDFPRGLDVVLVAQPGCAVKKLSDATGLLAKLFHTSPLFAP